MSGLAKMQERLSSAFGGQTPKGDEAPREDYLASRRDEAPDEAQIPKSDTEGRYRLLFAGVGLLAAAVALAVGYEAGLYAVAGILAVVGCGSLLAYLLQKRRAGPVVAVHPAQDSLIEQKNDELWQRNESFDLLSSVHDTLGDIAVRRGMDRRILHANRTFRDMTGCHSPDGKTCEEIGLAFRPGDSRSRFDVEIATPHGQRIFAWHDVVIRDPQTGLLIIQSIARDVTDERLSARTKEEARLKAETANAAKSRLLATVSHEIRTPLSGILGMNHLLEQTQLTSEQQNYLNGIRQSGHALAQLVEDLLDFSTIEAGRFKLSTRSENLRNLLESVVEMMAHRAHEKGIEIGAAVSPDIPDLLDFDPARLRQVLFNVIGNAVKFTREGGVLIHADLEGSELLVRVSDTGPGMTAEEQTRVFGEFEQAGTARDQSNGTGLGLAISARIMREFGGRLEVSSKNGRGSVFTIRFPVRFEVQPADRNERRCVLANNHVLLLAPEGPASAAIAETIRMLGGSCRQITRPFEARAELEISGLQSDCTDVIVDHRFAGLLGSAVAALNVPQDRQVRRILLVNPEERGSQPQDMYDAWLIRPLREKSLIDVLRGRMRGPEKRDVLNDNQPGFGTPAPDVSAVTGLEVLLAEDDPVNAMLVRAVLQKSGHKVRAVEDFHALLDAVLGSSGQRPDIIISDLNMPGGDGMEVLARIRADERDAGREPVPVIVLTGDDRETTRRDALVNGANLVLSKPAEPQRLLTELLALASHAARRKQ